MPELYTRFSNYSENEVQNASSKNPQLWDSFLDQTSEGTSIVTQKNSEACYKIFKILVYIFVFIMVLSTTVASKLSMLLMTSMIATNTTVPYCMPDASDTRFHAVIPDVQQIGWIWALIFANCLPDVLTWLRACRLCYYKDVKKPTIVDCLMIGSCESVHTVGLAMLIFLVLPRMDAVKGIMLTNCVCLLPAVLGLLSPTSEKPRKGYVYIFHTVAIAAQAITPFIWPAIYTDHQLWIIPVALVLISFQWWENYVSPFSPLKVIRRIANLRERISESRYFIYLLVAPWKIVLFIGLAFAFCGFEMGFFFTEFPSGLRQHNITIEADNSSTFEVTSSRFTILWVFIAQIVASYLANFFTKFACKIQIQQFSFAAPVNLTVPVGVTTLLIVCHLREADPCHFENILPGYLFFITPKYGQFLYFVVNQSAWIWIFWPLSQLIVTAHLWRPSADKNASTDTLFIMPWYNAMLIDQSLALNRRRIDQEGFVKRIGIDRAAEACEFEMTHGPDVKAADSIPQLLVCGTMWHETKGEMLNFLKSILRLDEDHCARRMARFFIQKDPEKVDKEYYDLESHIFFDDAFLPDCGEVDAVNSYVKDLIHTVDDAVKQMYGMDLIVRKPKKVVTPYGGRLIWVLPGRSKLICHLKNKNKIRHKKRWSQVMYMYYLLGYRIMHMNCSRARKLAIAHHTFILALDGDIDFQPKAVQLLISRMKVDPKLGAACGRIHPMGSGPMVWYQTFEYAIGHWLQKSTEHVLGCVLCSPGCFSLFRGRALMENSVLRKYTTTAEAPEHYVQYDQGEDRWLCTLLLKQGFRIEYCAASDSYTHAPEGFNEFFNQRRRWLPSTMYNIFDLLNNARHVSKTNTSMSMLYMTYQTLLFGGSILGPGTIFLMLVGAISAVFHVSIWTSFFLNFSPIVNFMCLCYWAPQKQQLAAAFWITSLYAIFMIAVFFAFIISIIVEGFLTPTSIFMVIMMSQIVISGILHPRECYALLSFFMYYITIPSMFLLLMIYAIFNMNDVSWGTRENPKTSDESLVKTKKRKFGFLKNDDRDGSVDFSCAGLFRCIFCTHTKQSRELDKLRLVSESLAGLHVKIEKLEKQLANGVETTVTIEEPKVENIDSEYRTLARHTSLYDRLVTSEDDTGNIDWLKDKDVGAGREVKLADDEVIFWRSLIEKYLSPIEVSPSQLADTKASLKELRNKMVFGFIMINVVFVLAVFLMQLNSEHIFIRWPIRSSPDEEYLRLEPIGLVFVFLFGVILLIQFLAMLVHRFATVSQILASTVLGWTCQTGQAIVPPELRGNGRSVSNALKWQRPKKLAKEDQSDLEVNFRRKWALKSGQPELAEVILNQETTESDNIPVGSIDIAVVLNHSTPRVKFE